MLWLFLTEGLVAFLLLCATIVESSLLYGELSCVALFIFIGGFFAGLAKRRWKIWECILPMLPFVLLSMLFALVGADLLAIPATLLIGGSALPGIVCGVKLSGYGRLPIS